MPRRILIAAALLLITAAPVFAQADFDTILADVLQSLRGDELQFDVPVDMGTLGEGTVSVLGYSLCMPADPDAPPAAEPTPPNNVYGCENTVVPSFTPSGADTWTLTLDVPVFFLDLHVTYALGSSDGYVTAATTLTVDVASETTDCERYHVVPGSAAIVITEPTGVFDDPLVQFAWNALSGELVGSIEEQAPQFEPLIDMVLDQVNQELCGVASEASSFGDLKARFR